MSIDKYFSRVYDKKNYNCAHLVREVWLDLTGNDIDYALNGFLRAPEERFVKKSERRHLKRLDSPQDPCIVLFQSPRVAPHVGIFIRGRLLHISEGKGVRFDRISDISIGINKITFLTCG